MVAVFREGHTMLWKTTDVKTVSKAQEMDCTRGMEESKNKILGKHSCLRKLELITSMAG